MTDTSQKLPGRPGRKPPPVVSAREVTAEEVRDIEWQDVRRTPAVPREAICMFVRDHGGNTSTKEAAVSAAACKWLHNHGLDTVLLKQSLDERYLAVQGDPLGIAVKQRKGGGGWQCLLRAPAVLPAGTYVLSALSNGMLVCAMPEAIPTERRNDNGSR